MVEGQDFEQFVSAACHNLREQLRGLRLRAEMAGGDVEMEDPIRTMESILDGMVEYSDACVGERVRCRVEMSRVLSYALVCLSRQIQGSAAVVTHDPLPAVTGDAQDLTKVLRHLLQNAIQFHGQGAPHIHVTAKREGPDCVLSVSDNGPGIEAAYREQVFIPFKRLHGRQIPGNGLGLAICKKLMERQDGKIWIAPKPDGQPGATVLFSLPLFD